MDCSGPKTNTVPSGPFSPITVKESQEEITGKFIVANKNFEKGATIFEESPLFHFNTNENLDPTISQCVTCGVMLKSASTPVHSKEKKAPRMRCSMCSWPVCSIECEEATVHAHFECNVLLENDLGYPEDSREGRDMATIARGFSIRCQNSLLWHEILDIMEMKSLDEFSSSKEIEENLKKCGKSVTPIKSRYPSFIYEHEPIVKEEIAAQLTILGRRAGFAVPTDENSSSRGSHMYLYKTASHFTNACAPNCVWHIGQDFRIRVRTASAIKEGQKLTVNRQTHSYVGFRSRQILYRNRFKRFCTCALCTDPTEGGTFQSGIVCSKCKEEQPRAIVSPQAEWQCSLCGEIKTLATFMDQLTTIYKPIQESESDESPSRKVVVEVMEKLMAESGGIFLHSNHWMIQQVISHYIKSCKGILRDGVAGQISRLRPDFEKICTCLIFLEPILEKICPGIHHERVRILGILGDTLLTLAKDVCGLENKFGKLTTPELTKLKWRLNKAEESFQETLIYWEGFPLTRDKDPTKMVKELGGKIEMAQKLGSQVGSRLNELKIEN